MPPLSLLFGLLLLGEGGFGAGLTEKGGGLGFFTRMFAGLEADELCVFVCDRSCESGWEGQMKALHSSWTTM